MKREHMVTNMGSGHVTYWILFLSMLSSHATEAVEYSAYACTNEYVQLACYDGKTIGVTDADYAQYATVCASGCCDPAPEDCSEAVADVRPEDWQNILDTCNNQTSCQVRNLGGDVSSCLSPYEADYMIIYFRCFPEDPTTTQPPTEPPTTEPTTLTTLPTRREQTTTPKDDGGGGTPVAAIIGGVIAAVLLVILIILLVYLIYRLRKKPLPKRSVKMVKRPSNAQRQANANGLPSNISQQTVPKSQTSTNQGPPSNEPVPPYVAYENKAFEQEVEIVTSKKPPAQAHDKLGVSNGLAGVADVKGNAPTTTSGNKNTYDNYINETKAQQTRSKTRPLSSQNNGNIPQRPKKPPVARASQLQATSVPNTESHRTDSHHYDNPKPRKKSKPNNLDQRQLSNTKSSTGSEGEHTYQGLSHTEGDAPPLEKKTVPPDNDYEDIKLKK